MRPSFPKSYVGVREHMQVWAAYFRMNVMPPELVTQTTQKVIAIDHDDKTIYVFNSEAEVHPGQVTRLIAL